MLPVFIQTRINLAAPLPNVIPKDYHATLYLYNIYKHNGIIMRRHKHIHAHRHTYAIIPKDFLRSPSIIGGGMPHGHPPIWSAFDYRGWDISHIPFISFFRAQSLPLTGQARTFVSSSRYFRFKPCPCASAQSRDHSSLTSPSGTTVPCRSSCRTSRCRLGFSPWLFP